MHDDHDDDRAPAQAQRLALEPVDFPLIEHDIEPDADRDADRGDDEIDADDADEDL
jgi:hypothetical protein